MNKVIYVEAFPAPEGKEVTRKVPTGEKKKAFFGGEKDVTTKVTEWEQTGWSDCRIDGKRLSNDIGDAVASLNTEGYEVQSVSPITSGKYNFQYEAKEAHSSGSVLQGGGYGWGYGYGYSYTEGVTIIAKKVAASAA